MSNTDDQDDNLIKNNEEGLRLLAKDLPLHTLMSTPDYLSTISSPAHALIFSIAMGPACTLP
jgi:hypothetical protein